MTFLPKVLLIMNLGRSPDL